MTTLREAAKAVLDRWDSSEYAASDLFEELRAALEQPKGLFIGMIAAQGPEFVEEVRRVGENIEQQAEPVAWVFAPNNELLWPSEVEVTNPIEIDSYQPLYTTPPQRKPLTWEQISQIGLECANDKSRLPFEVKLARAIEQAHGIKGEV